MRRLRRRWLRIGDHRISVRVGGPVAGGAAPVVLVPGLTMSGRYLVPTARALAADRRVVVPDLPGSGRSPHAARPLTVAELADLLHELVAATTGPAVLVANSFGCQVAVELALRHPAAVRRLVLTSPVLAPRVRGRTALAGRFVAAMRHEPWRYLAIVLLDNVRGWTRKGRANLRSMRAYPLEERVARLAVPTVVVRSRRDPLVPPPFVRRLADLVSGGRYVEIAAPHALPYDAPAAVARLVRSGDRVTGGRRPDQASAARNGPTAPATASGAR